MSPSPSPMHARSPSPDDIAAAMGFASFGSKPNPPKKKRKIAGTEPDHEGSGSNNTPLGMRVRGGMNAGHGAGDGRDAEGQGYERQGYEGSASEGQGDGERVGTERYGEEGQESERPGETDRKTSEGTPDMRRQQNVIVPKHNLKEQRLLEEARQRGLQRLEQMSQESGGGRRANGEWDWNALRKGVRDERGDMAFYDASFVEDPWRDLGRDPRGATSFGSRTAEG